MRSYLDPEGSRELSRRDQRFMESVLRSCRNKRIPTAFLTLTYDPTPWGDLKSGEAQINAYEAARRDNHVHAMFKRLKAAGYDYKGKWRARIEFQKSGMVHFHVLVWDWQKIDPKLLAECWGLGFVSMKWAKHEHAAYIAKYMSKYGAPDWLYDQPPGAFRAWSSSPGFGSVVSSSEKQPLQEETGLEVTSEGQTLQDTTGLQGDRKRVYLPTQWRMYNESMWPEPPREGETMREAIDRHRDVVRFLDDNANALEVKVPLSGLIVYLQLNGVKIERFKWGWYEIDSDLQYIAEAVRNTRMLLDGCCDATPSYVLYPESEADAGPPATRAARMALNLIEQQKRSSHDRITERAYLSEWHERDARWDQNCHDTAMSWTSDPPEYVYAGDDIPF